MPLTRANVESILIRRCGKLLIAADLDGTTVSGSNADLNDPIGWAVRQSGAVVDSAVAVADADVARVDTTDLDKLLDLAELRTLESVLNNFDDVNVKAGPREEDWGDFIADLETRIARKQKIVERRYGIGLGSLTTGVIALSFQEQNEP